MCFLGISQKSQKKCIILKKIEQCKDNKSTNLNKNYVCTLLTSSSNQPAQKKPRQKWQTQFTRCEGNTLILFALVLFDKRENISYLSSVLKSKHNPTEYQVYAIGPFKSNFISIERYYIIKLPNKAQKFSTILNNQNVVVLPCLTNISNALI